MSGLATWLGVLCGVAAAAQVFSTVTERVKRAKDTHQNRLRQVREASQQVRERARATLELRREERAMQVEIEQLTGRIDTGETTVQKMRSAEAFLYIYDERKGATDSAFLVTIQHPNFAEIARNPPSEVAQSWAKGRRYLVWAANAKAAGQKSTLRFPAERGYVVSEAEAYSGNAEEL